MTLRSTLIEFLAPKSGCFKWYCILQRLLRDKIERLGLSLSIWSNSSLRLAGYRSIDYLDPKAVEGEDGMNVAFWGVALRLVISNDLSVESIYAVGISTRSKGRRWKSELKRPQIRVCLEVKLKRSWE